MDPQVAALVAATARHALAFGPVDAFTSHCLDSLGERLESPCSRQVIEDPWLIR